MNLQRILSGFGKIHTFCIDLSGNYDHEWNWNYRRTNVHTEFCFGSVAQWRAHNQLPTEKFTNQWKVLFIHQEETKFELNKRQARMTKTAQQNKFIELKASKMGNLIDFKVASRDFHTFSADINVFNQNCEPSIFSSSLDSSTLALSSGGNQSLESIDVHNHSSNKQQLRIWCGWLKLAILVNYECTFK